MKYSISVVSLMTLAVICKFLTAQEISLKEVRDRLTALEANVTDHIQIFDDVYRTLSVNILEKDKKMLADMIARSLNINTTEEANFFANVSEFELVVRRHLEILRNVTVIEEYEFISLIGRGQSLIARANTAILQTYRVVLSESANRAIAKLIGELLSQLITSVHTLYDGVALPPEQRQAVKEKFGEIEKKLTDELARLPSLLN